MQSFQTLVTLVTLMLFVSKEAAALPVALPNTASKKNIGASTNSARDLEDRFFNPLQSYSPLPPPAPNSATASLNVFGNQAGTTSGDVNNHPVIVGSGIARDLEDRFFIPLPVFRPPPPPAAAAGNTATTTLDTSGNQIGVTSGDASDNHVTIGSGNLNPTSHNSARDLEDRFFIPLPVFRPPPPPAPAAGNTATTTLNTSGNQVGVASGNGSDNHVWVGQGNINPTSTNSAREVD